MYLGIPSEVTEPMVMVQRRVSLISIPLMWLLIIRTKFSTSASQRLALSYLLVTFLLRPPRSLPSLSQAHLPSLQASLCLALLCFVGVRFRLSFSRHTGNSALEELSFFSAIVVTQQESQNYIS